MRWVDASGLSYASTGRRRIREVSKCQDGSSLSFAPVRFTSGSSLPCWLICSVSPGSSKGWRSASENAGALAPRPLSSRVGPSPGASTAMLMRICSRSVGGQAGRLDLNSASCSTVTGRRSEKNTLRWQSSRSPTSPLQWAFCQIQPRKSRTGWVCLRPSSAARKPVRRPITGANCVRRPGLDGSSSKGAIQLSVWPRMVTLTRTRWAVLMISSP